jgi:hypothetical protein
MAEFTGKLNFYSNFLYLHVPREVILGGGNSCSGCGEGREGGGRGRAQGVLDDAPVEGLAGGDGGEGGDASDFVGDDGVNSDFFLLFNEFWVVAGKVREEGKERVEKERKGGREEGEGGGTGIVGEGIDEAQDEERSEGGRGEEGRNRREREAEGGRGRKRKRKREGEKNILDFTISEKQQIFFVALRNQHSPFKHVPCLAHDATETS